MAAHRTHRTRHHRHVVLGGAHVFLQVGMGARRRSGRVAGARQIVRQATLLDAGRADRNRRVPGESCAQRSGRKRVPRGDVCSRRRVLRRHSGHCHRCLAHRVSRRGQAGRDGRCLSDRLSHGAHGGVRRRADHRRRIRVSHELPHHGGTRVDRRSHHLAGARTGARHRRERSATRGARGCMARFARALAELDAGYWRVVHGRDSRARSWTSLADMGSGLVC